MKKSEAQFLVPACVIKPAMARQGRHPMKLGGPVLPIYAIAGLISYSQGLLSEDGSRYPGGTTRVSLKILYCYISRKRKHVWDSGIWPLLVTDLQYKSCNASDLWVMGMTPCSLLSRRPVKDSVCLIRCSLSPRRPVNSDVCVTPCSIHCRRCMLDPWLFTL